MPEVQTPRPKIDPLEMSFVQTADGRLGMGYCPDKEAGGMHIVKWCPPSMIRLAAAEILREDATLAKPGR